MSSSDKDDSRTRPNPLSRPDQLSLAEQRAAYFEEGAGETFEKLSSIMRFVSRQDFAKISVLTDLFRETEGVEGSIVECGVFLGNGVMTFAQAAASYEPYNYTCKIIGFDTFEGAIGRSEHDTSTDKVHHADGDFNRNNFEDLKRAIDLFDRDRPINHMPKVELVKGDVRETAPQYIVDNPETSIRLLRVSMPFYEPVKIALQTFLPFVNKGGIVVVDAYGFDSGITKGAREALGEERKSFEQLTYYPILPFFRV